MSGFQPTSCGDTQDPWNPPAIRHTSPPMSTQPPPSSGRDEDGFSEREFYRREFRGRTLALTLPRAYEGEAQRLVPVVQELQQDI